MQNLILEVLGKDVSAKQWIDDFISSDNPKFVGKSKETRRKMAIAAYMSKQNESLEESGEKKAELVSKILSTIHKANSETKQKHLKYLKSVLHPDDYNHIETSLKRANEELEEAEKIKLVMTPDGYAAIKKPSKDKKDVKEDLNEALRSKKSYGEMSNFLHAAPDNHFQHNASSLLVHGLGHNDRVQDDYARHAALFHPKLSDKHLDDISSHIANIGKTTNELDKNFHKNVHSVGVLRAALKNDSPDIIKEAKKSITADHKHAIFTHGSHEEKAFLLHHGLANHTQLKDSLENGNDAIRAVAKSHLQKLKAAGDTKHEDLFHHIAPKDKPADTGTFFSKLKDKVKGVFKSDRVTQARYESLLNDLEKQDLLEAKKHFTEIFSDKVSDALYEIKSAMARGSSEGVYHDTYSSALNHAYSHAESKGYKIDDEDYHKGTTHVDPKPEIGKTKRLHFPLTKDGVASKKALHVQVYNRGNDVKSKYELNHYIS